LQNKEDVEEEKEEKSAKGDDKTPIVLEALPTSIGYSKSFTYRKRYISVLLLPYTT